ncbi:MAG TPA: hypothetical protein VGF77_17400 [Allosphingosinicella sp.]|jgi:hypothetical protein
MNAGTVIGGGFRLMRERPLAVAVWFVLYLAATVAINLATLPWLRSTQAEFAATNSGAMSPAAFMGAMLGRAVLFGLIFIILYVVLIAASQRAVLRPGPDRFFYLRLGMDELRLLALAIILAILFYFGAIVASMIAAAIVGIVIVASGSGAMAPAIFLPILAIVLLSIWFEVRFALAFPLTLMRRKIIIGEAWVVTRGRFWTLFGAFLAIMLLLIALTMVVALVTNAAELGAMLHSGSDPLAAQQAAQAQMAAQLGGISGRMVLQWVLGAIVGTFGIVLFGGAIATAAKELTVNLEDIAETFA